METFRSTEGAAATRGAGLRAGLLVAGTAVAALAVSGCDEGRLTKSAYEQNVRTQYATVQEAFASTRNTSGGALATKLESAQRALRDAAESLEASEPPEQVEEENEELVEGMRAYADQLDEVIGAAAKGRRAAIDRFSAELADNGAIEQMAEAAEEMRFKGYDLGRIAQE